MSFDDGGCSEEATSSQVGSRRNKFPFTISFIAFLLLLLFTFFIYFCTPSELSKSNGLLLFPKQSLFSTLFYAHLNLFPYNELLRLFRVSRESSTQEESDKHFYW